MAKKTLDVTAETLNAHITTEGIDANGKAIANVVADNDEPQTAAALENFTGEKEMVREIMASGEYIARYNGVDSFTELDKDYTIDAVGHYVVINMKMISGANDGKYSILGTKESASSNAFGFSNGAFYLRDNVGGWHIFGGAGVVVGTDFYIVRFEIVDTGLKLSVNGVEKTIITSFAGKAFKINCIGKAYLGYYADVQIKDLSVNANEGSFNIVVPPIAPNAKNWKVDVLQTGRGILPLEAHTQINRTELKVNTVTEYLKTQEGAACRFNGTDSEAELNDSYILNADGDYIEFYGRGYDFSRQYGCLGLFGDGSISKNVLGFSAVNDLWLRQSNGAWVFFNDYTNYDIFKTIKLAVVNAGTQWQLSVNGSVVATLTKSSSLVIDRVGSNYLTSVSVEIGAIAIHNATQDLSIENLCFTDSAVPNNITFVLNEDLPEETAPDENLSESYFEYKPTGFNGKQQFFAYTRAKIGSNYFFGFEIVNYYNMDDMVYADLFRIVGCKLYLLINGSMTDTGNIILTSGENECVYKRSGRSDYTGGYHGDEQHTQIDFYIDSVRLMYSELAAGIELTACKEFMYVQKSTTHETSLDGVNHIVGHPIEFIHHKKTVIANGNYTVNNRLIAQQAMNDINVAYLAISCLSLYISEYVQNEQCNIIELNEAVDNKLRTVDKTFHLWSETNKIGVKVEAEFSINNDTCKQFIWDTPVYHKYYRDAASEGELAVNVGDVWESEFTVQFYRK